MKVTTTIDKAGRIVLPKKMRERLSLDPGTKLECRDVAGGIEIRVADAGDYEIVEEGGLLVIDGRGPVDAREAVRASRRERDEKIQGRLSR